MKIKAGVNLHNRFDIVKNGEWVGYAENIILDQMYDRICNFSSYFNNIHFGTGSGTPTPDRTSLFSHLGTKTAVTEEIVKASPTSKWTRKIVLNPEEYVGRTITEVGVAYGSNKSNLVTHAMIKDAEGNPLSIDKTDIDVIEIYATVFITVYDSDGISFVDEPYNVLTSYFTGSSWTTPQIEVGSYGGDTTQTSCALVEYEATPTVTVDVPGKKVTFSNRVPIGAANNRKISEVGLKDVLRVKIEELNTFVPHVLADIAIGSGDGSTQDFNLNFVDINNLSVKVGGVIETGYSLSNQNYLEGFPNIPLGAVVDLSYPPTGVFKDVFRPPYHTDTITSFTRFPVTGENKMLEFKSTKSLLGLIISVETHYTSYYSIIFYYDSSSDGVTWTNRFVGDKSPEIQITHSDLYHRFRVKVSSVSSSYVRALWLKNVNTPKLHLNTAPASGSLVTISGTLDYYPKDENYVLDSEISIQFGEGV